MNVIPILVICSLFLVACAVALFAWSVRLGDHEHTDRLALLPLDEDVEQRKEPLADEGSGERP
jgi:cbb3-type cytochrome oxidase maturation protein